MCCDFSCTVKGEFSSASWLMERVGIVIWERKSWILEGDGCIVVVSFLRLYKDS